MAAQGDLKIATAGKSNLMAFVSNKTKQQQEAFC